MAKTWRLLSQTTGRTVVERLQIADGFWSRLLGLQFRRQLPADAGLLLAPCTAIHTFFVRFPLDIVFLDRTGRVLAIYPQLRPWRQCFGPAGTYATLELAAGVVDLSIGEVLRMSVSGMSVAPPTVASFLQE